MLTANAAAFGHGVKGQGKGGREGGGEWKGHFGLSERLLCIVAVQYSLCCQNAMQHHHTC